MIRKNKHRPLYREVVREALMVAWQERRLWVFALFAGILQTGGIMDVILYTMRGLSVDRGLVLESGNTWSLGGSAFALLGWLQGLLYGGLLVGALLAASVIAQGALVYGLGMRVRGKAPTFRQCLTAGAKNLWPVAAVNVVALGLIWIARFLVLVPFAFSASAPTPLTVVAYFLSTLLFLLASVAFTTIHLFALNAIVLQDASVWEALDRSYHFFKRGWLVAVETGALMLLVGVAVLVVALAAAVVMGVPVFILLVAAALVQWNTLAYLGYFLGVLLFFALLLGAGAYTITFQYAAWGRIYRRLGEGGAVARMHRWLHWLFDPAA